MPENTKFALAPKVINGSVAGIVGVTCVFPLDLVKTRLQNQREGSRVYKNILDCAVKTFRNEGFFGMYRGSGVNLLLITPEKAIKLVGNDFFRHRLQDPKTGKLTIGQEIFSGACAGSCQIIITTPMELLKIQLQDSGRSERKVGASAAKHGAPLTIPQVRAHSTAARPATMTATSIALRLIREKGIVGLYRGSGATFLRDVTFSAIYFPLFAHLNSLGKQRDGGTAVFYVSFMAGLVSAGASSFLVTPIDVVKTRLQTIRHAHGEEKYHGFKDCIVKTYKNEGAQAFFKGAVCRVMVVAPLFGIAQVVYYLGIGERLLGVQY